MLKYSSPNKLKTTRCTLSHKKDFPFVANLVNIKYKDLVYLSHTLKGNMHHKHDVSLKDAFYIIDLAAGFFFENFES